MVSTLLRTLLLLSSVLLSQQIVTDRDVQMLYSWRFPDWRYPSQEARQVAQAQRNYVPENGVILDSDFYISPRTRQRRVFVTTPQFRTGIPATVSEVTSERNRNGEYLLAPFPSWDASIWTACNAGALSVYRVHIDRCGLLWVLDTGRVNTFDTVQRPCNGPRLFIYDLNNNDTVIARYDFPSTSVNERSNLVTLVTESYQDNCLDSVAYIADVNAYAMVVFDLPRRDSWRVENNFFYPFPHRGLMTINGATISLMDGLLGMALSPPTVPDRLLYFHSFASTREGRVPTRILRNATLANQLSAYSEFYMSEDVREGQTSLEVMTDDGIMIYAVITRTAISCWNSATPFTRENLHIVYENVENLQFISGMKLKGDQLLVTTSRLQNYINGIRVNSDDIKYRVMLINVNQLLSGTPCQRSNTDNSNTSGDSGLGTRGGGGSSGSHEPTRPGSTPARPGSIPSRPGSTPTRPGSITGSNTRGGGY